MQNRSRTLWIAAGAFLALAAALIYPATRERLGWFASSIAPEAVSHQVHTLTGPQPEAWVRSLDFPEGELTAVRREVLFDGATATSADFSAHMTFLPPGKSPMQPHKHADDELIVPIEGELEVLMTDSRGPLKEHIGPGKFVFNAADQPHAVSGISEKRSRYLVLKWTGRAPQPFEAEVGSSVFSFHKAHRHHLKGEPKNFQAETILEGATRNLKKFHSHASTLMPGAGYPAQKDPIDIAIVLMQGTVKTLDVQATAPAMFFYPAGRPHGLENAGTEPAQYIVFEFHGR